MRTGRSLRVLAAIYLLASVASCGNQASGPAGVSAPASCPVPQLAPNSPVSAAISPSIVDVPGSGLDSDYGLQVPVAAQLLVVKVDSHPTSRNTFIPSFTAPDGSTITRSQLLRDDIVGGNPGDLGMSELMQLQSPQSGAWILRLHNTTGAQVTVQLKATALFHVHVPPIVAAGASPDSGPAPLKVQFDATQTKLDGAKAAYCWDFRDGTAAIGERVSHTFRAPGTYQVTITAIDDRGGAGYGYTVVTVNG